MRGNTRAFVVALCVLLGLALSGCSDDATRDSDTLDLSTSPSQSPSQPSRSASESPSADASGEPEIPTNYPTVGLEFTSLPKAAGAKREALQTYIDYEQGQRKLSRTQKLNPLITDNAAPSVVDVMRSTVDHLKSTDTVYTGTARIKVAFEGFNGRQAVLSLCTDGTDLSLVTNGQKRPIKGLVRVGGRVTLSNTEGVWTLTDYNTLDESC